MNITLIGASGFLGHHVVHSLSGEGHQCKVLTRQRARRRDLALLPGVSVVQADVHDPGQLGKAIEGADAVVSMAGILNEPGHSGKGFEKVHVQLVGKIIDACRQSGVQRLLHISALGVDEGESHYLRSKKSAEELLAASGLQVTVLRPSVIFGPGDQFFNRFAGLLRWTPVLPLACPGAVMQPVYAGDVASAMCRSLQLPEAIGATYELGGPRVYSLQELVRKTARMAGLKRWVPGLPAPLSRLQAAVLDWVPGKPFSSDNYRSLQTDNVTSHDGFADLGLQPRSLESCVPDYLGRSPRQRRLDESRSGTEKL